MAKVVKVLGEVIRNFDDEAAVVYFNTFNDNSFSHGAFNASQCTFNPLDKLMEQVEKNEKLYEALLKSEREKIELLQSMMKK